MLVIPDFGLIWKIAQRQKTTHRVPAGLTRDGFITDPKWRVQSEHKIFERAPYGSHGNKAEPWYLTVYIAAAWTSTPVDWSDEDMVYEGFEDLYDFGQWWDRWRAGENKYCKTWAEMQSEHFHCCSFVPVGKSIQYDVRLGMHQRQLGLQ
jgi:hypothetical protein